jgi:hypothetical protein
MFPASAAAVHMKHIAILYEFITYRSFPPSMQTNLVIDSDKFLPNPDPIWIQNHAKIMKKTHVIVHPPFLLLLQVSSHFCYFSYSSSL